MEQEEKRENKRTARKRAREEERIWRLGNKCATRERRKEEREVNTEFAFTKRG